MVEGQGGVKDDSQVSFWATDEQNRFGEKNKFNFGYVELEASVGNQINISTWQLNTV